MRTGGAKELAPQWNLELRKAWAEKGHKVLAGLQPQSWAAADPEDSVAVEDGQRRKPQPARRPVRWTAMASLHKIACKKLAGLTNEP